MPKRAEKTENRHTLSNIVDFVSKIKDIEYPETLCDKDADRFHSQEELSKYSLSELKGFCLHNYNVILIKWMKLRLEKEYHQCTLLQKSNREVKKESDEEANIKEIIAHIEQQEEELRDNLCYSRYLLDVLQKLERNPEKYL